MFFRSWVSSFMCASFLYTTVEYQGTRGKTSCVFFLDDSTYNMTSLQSEIFETHHRGYRYSFNPCTSITVGPPSEINTCQSDVAICRWVEDQQYLRIGRHSEEKFGYYQETNIPRLQYSSEQSGIIWKPTVLLVCKPTEERGKFKLWRKHEAEKFVFNLTHKCACPNMCLISPSEHSTKDPTTSKSNGNQTEKNVITSAAGGVVLFSVAIFIWLRIRRGQRNDENAPLLGDNRDDVVDVQNEFPSEGSGLTSERGSASFRSSTRPTTDSSCSDITVPNKKDNLKCM